MNVAKLMMEKGRNVFLVKSYAKIQDKHLIKPRGGGGGGRYRGVRTCVTYFAEHGVFF